MWPTTGTEVETTVNGADRGSDSPAIKPDGEHDEDLVALGTLAGGDKSLVSAHPYSSPDADPANTGGTSDPGPPTTNHGPTVVGSGAQAAPDDMVDAIFIDVDQPVATNDSDRDGPGDAVDLPDIPDITTERQTADVESANASEPPDPEVQPVAVAGPEPTNLDLEMRQVAGLTSGSSMTLLPGNMYEFTESTKGVSFGLKLVDDGQVIVFPGSAHAIINEVEVTEPAFLGNGILQVGSACFSVRPVRPTTSDPARSQQPRTDPTAVAAITVPPLDQSSGPFPTNGRIGEPPTPADTFLHTVRRTRDSVAERHRLTHPDPEELKSRLDRLEAGLWDRGTDHRLFGRFSVAYSTIPWQPRFDTPELIPERLHQAIVKMSLLPWVPVTANLKQGPLGIVGSRAATLACARHAVLSLAALTAPGDIGFWVLTGRRHLEDWQWTTSLPISMSPEGGGSFMVAVVDGMSHYDKAGLDQDEVDSGRLGLIALAVDETELPKRCGTVLQLHADGSAAVTNHLGETIPGTPIGVTQAFALDMATRIADLLADTP